MTSSKIKLKEKIVFPPPKCCFCPKAIMLEEKKTMYNIDTNHRDRPQTAGFIGLHTCVNIGGLGKKAHQ